MVQFLSINFFSWISSIFVGFFKSSRFFVSPCISGLLFVQMAATHLTYDPSENLKSSLHWTCRRNLLGGSICIFAFKYFFHSLNSEMWESEH